MQRRIFLQFVASLLPASALSNRLQKYVSDEPQEENYVVNLGNKIRKACDTPCNDRVIYSGSFCDRYAKIGQVAELAQFSNHPHGGYYIVVRPGFYSGQPLGIFAQNVVGTNPDFNSVFSGSRVQLIQAGKVILGPFLKPIKQGTCFYYNKQGNITTVKQTNQKPIAIALKDSDEDSFVLARISLYVNKRAELPSAT